jgi:hypothetical protein
MTASGALADRVRNVRGVFGLSKTFRFVFGVIMILFGVVLPAFFAYVIYSSHIPMSSWNADVWTVAALIPASAAVGCVIFWVTQIRWQFTETEIVALKPGGVSWRLAHSEITAFEIRKPAWWMRILWLQTAKGKYPIVLSDTQLARSVDSPDT